MSVSQSVSAVGLWCAGVAGRWKAGIDRKASATAGRQPGELPEGGGGGGGGQHGVRRPPPVHASLSGAAAAAAALAELERPG